MRIILILCLIFISVPLFSEDISLEIINSYPIGNILLPVYEDGNFYFRGIEKYKPGKSVKSYDYKIFSVSSRTGKLKTVLEGGVNCFKGDKELLIVKAEENKKTRKREKSLILYDFHKQSIDKVFKGHPFAEFMFAGLNSLYYQNDTFFSSGPSDDVEIMEDLYYFSVAEGFQKRIIEGIHPVSMTKDRLHILLYPDIRTGFRDQFLQIKVSEMDKAVKERSIIKGLLDKENPHYPGLQISFKKNFICNIRYISNNLLFAPIRRRAAPVWTLFDLTGKKIDTVNFSLGTKPLKEIMYIQFSDDFSRAIVMEFGGTTVYLLDSSEFRHWLNSRNLLFQPARARLNDSHVQLREYPNLKAKILGQLSRGNEVDVLDRSGIKVPIGEMNDYWYEVKTKKGKTGWSYGAFLDFIPDEEAEEN